MIPRRTICALSLLPALGGCIAAAIPIAASSAIVRKGMEEKRDQRVARTKPARPVATQVQGAPADGRWQVMPGVTALPAPDGTFPTARPATSAPAPSAPATTVPEAMQYLYGSGEGAAGSIQAYRGLTRYLADIVVHGRKDRLRQVILSDGASLNAPQFEPCGPKPLAIVLDIDETVLLNLGYEADAARRGESFDAARWERWEQTGADKIVAVPGAKMAVDAARGSGITVIFNSNRTAQSAAQTEAALDFAGLGPARHGSTLWLKGDDGGGSAKDDRRWAIASGYCVIALVGDQLGDFSDLFNDPKLTPSTRRALAGSVDLAGLWGNGWFMLPNPVYGSALKGGFDDIFPVTTRWADPAEEKK
ncbi:5'-nucleotidase, lipoprotein e(P4) family [Sphingomonas sp.]|uniref:5'-nucleotidase, lipoprotein e(P4) family n=1 Tax=Sphingomonas sp. TaxID=28214 RepID=UPI002DD6350E|nr:HAD family acid phosphatase [Sphingomonas sp.]